MWEAAVPIFDDEDENELISEFVRLSALYPKKQATEITAYIFKNLRDPFPRANQAAMRWAEDLEISERIRKAKLNGGTEPEPIDDKETMLRKIEAWYNDEDAKLADRIKAAELHAKIAGHIDGDDEDVAKLGRRAIVINYQLDPRSQDVA